MSDLTSRDHDALDSRSLPDELQPLVAQFEADWQRAMQGDAPPQLEPFVTSAPEAYRSQLRRSLQKIQQRYQLRLSSNRAPDTVDFGTAGRDTEGASIHDTAIFRQSLVGPEADSSTASSDEAATIDPEATIDPQQTVDPQPTIDAQSANPLAAGNDATQDFEVAATGMMATRDFNATGGASDFSLDPEALQAPRRRRGGRLPTVAGYQLLSELGRGGMGVVYRARHTGLNRLVALKMILAGGHAGSEQLARFRAEAEAVAQLKHPNIVQIYDVGEQDGLPFFSLEFVDGQSLDADIDGKPQLPARSAELVEMLARAMHHAHEQGIIHRDLKPGNVLLTSDGVPKITDFGLVKRIEGDSSQTRTGTIMGTPSYMAPEQGRGDKNVGPPADIYALGSILYCLLTGRPPFLAATPLDTLMQLLREEPVPPSRLQSKIPIDLETICLKCLQKDRQKRYESAAALADDLHRFLNGEPIEARPVGRAERLWRWCKRNPTIAIPSGIAALLALAVMIGAPVAAAVIYQEKELAVEAQQLAERSDKLAQQRADEAKAAQAIAEQNEQLAVKARSDAVEAKDLAEKQSLLALDTLQTLVQEVQQQLQDRPAMQGLRRELLQTALAGLDSVASSAATATQVDVNKAGAHRRLGDMYLEIGQTEKALEQYQRCYQIVRQFADQGQLPNPELNLSKILTHMADAYLRLGDAAAARDQYQQALEVRQQWLDDQRDNLGIKQLVAASYGSLAQVLLLLGDPQAARDYSERALDLRQQWLTHSPGDANAQGSVAGAKIGLGDAYVQLGNSAMALELYQQALETHQALAAAHPDTLSDTWNLALTYNKMGAASLLADDPQNAIGLYQEGLRRLQSLLDRDPQNANLRRDVAVLLYGLATSHLHADNRDEAQHVYEQSLALRQELAENDPSDARAQTDYMIVLARAGQHERAAEIAQQQRASASDPRILYHVACCYAQCAAAVRQGRDLGELDEDVRQLYQRYAREAVDTLKQAIDQGYKGMALLELDPDLAPLRELESFQQLLRGIESSGSTDSVAQEQR